MKILKAFESDNSAHTSLVKQTMETNNKNNCKLTKKQALADCPVRHQSTILTMNSNPINGPIIATMSNQTKHLKKDMIPK